MSNIPVTGMSSGEFLRVFGSDPTPIHDDEIIIDIGSGLSRLEDIAPYGTIAQLDPIYSASSDDGHCIKIPIEIGANTESKKAIKTLENKEIDRVTCGNTLRHLGVEDRAYVISQMLRLSVNGILQIYPTNQKRALGVINEAEKFGFEAIIQSPQIRGIRQLVYGVARVNTVFSIISQPVKVGPSDHLRMARSIANI